MSDDPIEPTFSTIRLSTLRGNRQIPFDAFVHVAGKYIPFCRRGELLEAERLDRLRRKHLKIMYVRDDERGEYESYVDGNIAVALDRANPLTERAEILHGIVVARTEDVMEDTLNPAYYQAAATTAGHLVEFVMAEVGAAGALIKVAHPEVAVPQHTLNVAALSVLVAKRMPGFSGGLTTSLALGALLHDTEKYLEPNFPWTQARNKFSPEELKRYQEHPLDGARRYGKAAHADPLVLNIIAGHEEQADGKGFPRALKGHDADPLVLLVAAVNAYDREVSFFGIEPKAALKHFLVDKMGSYPLPILQALQDTLKAEGVV